MLRCFFQAEKDAFEIRPPYVIKICKNEIIFTKCPRFNARRDEQCRFLRADIRNYCVKALGNTNSISFGLFLVLTDISSPKTASTRTVSIL